MTELLRAEVVAPRRTSWALLFVPLVVPLALLSTCERTEKRTVFTPSVAKEPEPQKPISSELLLVFRDGDHSYVQLHDATGRVGTKVIVDNDCTATIVGITTIHRLATDGEEVDPAEGVDVLAGQLDQCDGTYARSADLSRVVVPETRPDDAELVKKAKRELLQSAAAAETTRVWVEDYQTTESWKAQAQYDIRTVRHPITQQTWISIHAWNEAGCGEAPVNLWGLFRVEQDGSLTATQLRDLGDMTKIQQIIDIEGDGQLELVGRPWLGLDVLVTRDSGEELERLPLPYVGCPC